MTSLVLCILALPSKVPQILTMPTDCAIMMHFLQCHKFFVFSVKYQLYKALRSVCKLNCKIYRISGFPLLLLSQMHVHSCDRNAVTFERHIYIIKLVTTLSLQPSSVRATHPSGSSYQTNGEV
jgi:hypothetical protein